MHLKRLGTVRSSEGSLALTKLIAGCRVILRIYHAIATNMEFSWRKDGNAL